jgi:uncharacterized membrane protein YphA (DoxX/SURF4 family)
MDERERVLLTLAGVRVFMGVFWLVSLLTKLPTDFGGDGYGGLDRTLARAHDHALTPVLRSLVDDVLEPHRAIAGWVVFLVTLVTGVSLALGLATRVGGVLGLLHALAATALVGTAPGEWLYGGLMLIVLSLLMLLLPVSRRLSVDDALGRDP